MKRIPLKGGSEFDAFSRLRRWLCYMQRPGVTKGIKRQYNKRFRKAAKRELEGRNG